MKRHSRVARTVLLFVADNVEKAARQCRTVQANREWQGTGVTVTPGQWQVAQWANTRIPDRIDLNPRACAPR
jgi:RNA polymerase subunit RPABC4/transcription elongation factor Spt4